mmetsp:Transcript_72448/g.167837  ORF Transcript_72448/g.167837 Transcript_72448/m.167837 type:complete len:102 (+) Transcript_72448:218-523(+)
MIGRGGGPLQPDNECQAVSGEAGVVNLHVPQQSGPRETASLHEILRQQAKEEMRLNLADFSKMLQNSLSVFESRLEETLSDEVVCQLQGGIARAARVEVEQ